MSSRIGLVGFVNTEEILADTMRLQSPDIIIDGYELFPNEAFGVTVDFRNKLYEPTTEGDDPYVAYSKKLSRLGYSAINVGPDTAALLLEDHLTAAGVDYVGPRKAELEIELDKTKIFDIFPNDSGVLPATHIVNAEGLNGLQGILDSLNGEAFVKFVGEYSDYYDDSEYRRVRALSEFSSYDEFERFARHSVESGGSVVIQQKVTGQEFSYTCLVDGNGGVYRLGENIFYKRREEGDRGPLCDGTGSISVGNTLPGLIGAMEVDYIQQNIVRPYIDALGERFGRQPKTFLNVDLIKSDDGRIYLLEINNRQAGGHTMSTLLAGLESPLHEALEAAQAGRLSELSPRFKAGAAVAVTIFPEIAPTDFASPEERPVLWVPKNTPEDSIRLYTGWVDVIDEDADKRLVQSNLTATVIAVNHAPSLEQARENVYAKIATLGLDGTGFVFRNDIGRGYVV